MKINVNSTQLLKAIKDLKVLLESKAILPILANVSIKAKSHELILQVTNLEQAYTIQLRNIYFEIEKEGQLTLHRASPCGVSKFL